MEISKKMGELIGGFLVLFFGLTLTLPIYEECQAVAANVTGTTQVFYGTIIPLIWAIGIVFAGVALLLSSRKE